MPPLDMQPADTDRRNIHMAKITIDGKEYDSEALSEEARNNLQNIQVCEQKIADLKRDMAIAQTARNAYAQALKGQLPKDA